MKRILLVAILVIAAVGSIKAKTEKFGTWIELELTKTFLKKFEISFIPDIRFNDDFIIDKYQFDGKLAYEPIRFLEFAAAYRIKTNVKSKENEVTQRWVLDATTKMDIGRFSPSLRARYVSYNDVDENRVNLLRPRFKVVYDIKNNKFAPYSSYELYHDLINKSLQKGRFDVGFTRKMGKLHRIGIYYRSQHYYNDTHQSINILGFDYRFKI